MPEKPTVKLIGEDGNALAIIGKVVKALRRAEFPAEHIEKYKKEAMSRDYDNLLVVTMDYVDVE